MEELQVIETTSGRQFKPWATKDDVQDPASVTAITSEIASGKQAIASAITAKGGTASATESFAELAQDIQDTPTSGVLSGGIVQSEPFSFMDYLCKLGAYPFDKISDGSIIEITRAYAFFKQTTLREVSMTAVTSMSAEHAFDNCSSLSKVNMPNLALVTTGYAFANNPSLVDVNFPSLVQIPNTFLAQCTAIKNITLPSLRTITSYTNFGNNPMLEEVELPLLESAPADAQFGGSNNLVNLILGTLTSVNASFLGSNKPKLRNISIGQDTNVNLPFNYWTATNVIAEGQSGIDELNANLQTNLISKLYQGGGKILRLGAALYDVTTQETRDMVTAKGWTLQRG